MVAAYTPTLGHGTQLANDPMKTTVPDVLSRIYGRKALVTFTAPKRFVLNWWKVSSGLWKWMNWKKDRSRVTYVFSSIELTDIQPDILKPHKIFSHTHQWHATSRTGIVDNYIYLAVYPNSFSSNTFECFNRGSDVEFKRFCTLSFKIVELRHWTGSSCCDDLVTAAESRENQFMSKSRPAWSDKAGVFVKSMWKKLNPRTMYRWLAKPIELNS